LAPATLMLGVLLEVSEETTSLWEAACSACALVRGYTCGLLDAEHLGAEHNQDDLHTRASVRHCGDRSLFTCAAYTATQPRRQPGSPLPDTVTNTCLLFGSTGDRLERCPRGLEAFALVDDDLLWARQPARGSERAGRGRIGATTPTVSKNSCADAIIAPLPGTRDGVTGDAFAVLMRLAGTAQVSRCEWQQGHSRHRSIVHCTLAR